MTDIVLQLTDAGLAAVQSPSGTDRVVIVALGLSAIPFDMAPTLTALPGEFKRLEAIAGTEAAPNITHMTAYDTSHDVWSATGFGLYLEDGTLFATFSAATAILSKAAPAFALLAFDIAFNANLASSIAFGDPIFTVPPATTEMRGIVELATPAEARAGVDPLRALTPATAMALLGALFPVGFTGLWYGTVSAAPAGWAICDGREVDRSDGTGKIATPDMRGRVPVGADGTNALGAKFGASSRTVSTTDAGAHTPTGTLATGQSTLDASTGITLATPTDSGTAQGGSGVRVTSASLTDPGHKHALGPLPLALDTVAHHSHAATIDITPPSLAWHFIMRV